uniref:Uncharacterized protein n=1 Tax=Salix viminalis TaxID=40686 RepID=A0A6N2JXU2_SALVM
MTEVFCRNPQSQQDFTRVMSMVQRQNNRYLFNDFSSEAFCRNPQSQQDLARVMSMVQQQNNQYLCNDFSSDVFCGNPDSQQDLAQERAWFSHKMNNLYTMTSTLMRSWEILSAQWKCD